MAVKIIAATADEVDGSVNFAILEIGAVSGNLCVLVTEHAYVFHGRFVSAVNGNGYTAFFFFTEVIVVADGEVLQIEPCAVAQVQYRVGYTVAVAVKHYAVAAFADERNIICCEALFFRSEIVIAVLNENRLACYIGRSIAVVHGSKGSLELIDIGDNIVVNRFFDHCFTTYFYRYIDSLGITVAISVLGSTGGNG